MRLPFPLASSSLLLILAGMVALVPVSSAQTEQPQAPAEGSRPGSTLELPAKARFDVRLVDAIELAGGDARQDDIMLAPVADAQGRSALPHYCVMVGDAKRDGDRLRLTTQTVTCVEAEGGDSHIFSGELVAGAYAPDGQFGLEACTDDRCELSTEAVFQLELTNPLSIEQMANPSAEINAKRRAEGPTANSDDTSE